MIILKKKLEKYKNQNAFNLRRKIYHKDISHIMSNMKKFYACPACHLIHVYELQAIDSQMHLNFHSLL